MIIIWLLLLPFRIALGLMGFTFKTGYRTGRVLGLRRMLTFGLGIGVGLLIAPGPGRELREKLRQRFEGYSPADGDADLADRVRFELTHSPKTWHLQQPQVDVVAGRVTLRGQVDAEAGRDELERAAAAVPGVQGVDNLVTVSAGAP
jgi:hypothetical protein